jgi:hypothetical protein
MREDLDMTPMQLASATVLTLADEVRAHLEHGDLVGRSVTLSGPAQRRPDAAAYARIVLADVEHCCAAPAERGVTVSAARWHELAEQLRAIERATHRGR